MLTSTAQGQREGNQHPIEYQLKLQPSDIGGMPMPTDSCQIHFISNRLLKIVTDNSATYVLRNAVNDSEDHLVHLINGLGAICWNQTRLYFVESDPLASNR